MTTEELDSIPIVATQMKSMIECITGRTVEECVQWLNLFKGFGHYLSSTAHSAIFDDLVCLHLQTLYSYKYLFLSQSVYIIQSIIQNG